jgi:hypothetical protein
MSPQYTNQNMHQSSPPCLVVSCELITINKTPSVESDTANPPPTPLQIGVSGLGIDIWDRTSKALEVSLSPPESLFMLAYKRKRRTGSPSRKRGYEDDHGISFSSLLKLQRLDVGMLALEAGSDFTRADLITSEVSVKVDSTKLLLSDMSCKHILPVISGCCAAVPPLPPALLVGSRVTRGSSALQGGIKGSLVKGRQCRMICPTLTRWLTGVRLVCGARICGLK